MEGLEISEIFYSQIHQENRYDSEFYQKAYVTNERHLRKKSFFQIGEQFYVTDGEHGSVIEQEFGIKYLTAENIKNGYIDITNVRYVNNEVDKKNARARVSVGDVLISIKGTLGTVGVAEEWLLPANMNRDVAILKPLFNKELSTVTALFLMSKYGLTQSSRGGSGGVQQMITLERLRKFINPTFSYNFSFALNELFQKMNKLRVQSQVFYAKAENLLLDTLGLAVFSPSTEKVNIKSFKDSFAVTGRLDAEYYQPKFDHIEDVFNQFPRIRLADLVNYPISSGVTPKAGGNDYADAENGIPFVRAVDLQNGQVSIHNFNYIKPEIHTGLLKRTKLKQNDFLFSIAGTVGRCAIFNHAFEANINQAVAILRFNDERVNHCFLMVLFNSPIGKEFVAKYARQGLQTNLNLTEVGDLSIPIIAKNAQTKIAAFVQQSFALKAESERLLNVAKRAVEIAIEQDENAGMAYIEQNT